MPFIYAVGSEHGINTKSDDALFDLLQEMGVSPANYSAISIKSAFHVALRRELLTATEADAGVAQCLSKRRKQLADLRKLEEQKDKHRIDGYNLFFTGAQPPRLGEDY